MECRLKGTLDKAGPSLPADGAPLGRRGGGVTDEGHHTGSAAGAPGAALGALGTVLIVDTGDCAGILGGGAELWAHGLP